MKRKRNLAPVDKHMRQFFVLRRVPQLDGDPSFVVSCSGSGTHAESVGHFFNQIDAEDYAKWRNKTAVIQRRPV